MVRLCDCSNAINFKGLKVPDYISFDYPENLSDHRISDLVENLQMRRKASK